MLDKTQLKIRKDAFIQVANIISAMQSYHFYKAVSTDQTRIKDAAVTLDLAVSIKTGIPLPSGRWGTPIALALEINDYISAEYLIDNAERLSLTTKTVSSNLGGANAWDLKNEYLFSQLTNEQEPLPKDVIQPEYYYRQYLKMFNMHALANKRLESKLAITEEDKNIFKLLP